MQEGRKIPIKSKCVVIYRRHRGRDVNNFDTFQERQKTLTFYLLRCRIMHLKKLNYKMCISPSLI